MSQHDSGDPVTVPSDAAPDPSSPKPRRKRRRGRLVLNLAVVLAAVGGGFALSELLPGRTTEDGASAGASAGTQTDDASGAAEGSDEAASAPVEDDAATAESGAVLPLSVVPDGLASLETSEPAILRFSETGDVAERYLEYELLGTGRATEFTAGAATWRAADGEEFILASLVVRNVSPELSPVVTLVVGDRRERLAQLPNALAVAVPVGRSDVALEVAVGALSQTLSLVDGRRDGDVRRVFDRDPATLFRTVGARYDEIGRQPMQTCRAGAPDVILEIGVRLDAVSLQVQRETTSQAAPAGEAWLVVDLSDVRYRNLTSRFILMGQRFDTEFFLNMAVTTATTDEDPAPIPFLPPELPFGSTDSLRLYALVPEMIEDFTLTISPRSDWRWLESDSLCGTGTIELAPFEIALDLR